MRKILIAGAFGTFLGGCAQDIYDRPGATPEQFSIDQGSCQMFVMGVPQVQPDYVPPSYTANTNYSGTYGMGMVNGTSSTTIQPDNTGQGMANLGAAIGTIIRKKQAMRACMAAHGYSLRQ